MKTKCLFGGALFGAGLCAGAGSSALAGDFVWGRIDVFVGVSYTSRNYRTNLTTTGDFGISTASTSHGASASMYGDSTGLSSFALSTGSKPAYTGGTSYFSVTNDMTVLLEWDFTADSIGASRGFIIDDYTYQPIFLLGFDSGSAESGSLTTTFYAGRQYVLQHNVFTGAGRGGSSFSVTVVPLPPAAFAGLGMLAGLGAYKRFRRR